MKPLDWGNLAGKRMPANPFFRPACEASRRPARDTVASAVKASIR
jgi:hypothetical protein